VLFSFFRLIARQKNIQNTLNAIHRFDADLKDYFLWLTKVDLVLKRHDEMTANRNASDDDLQEVTRAFKVGDWWRELCDPDLAKCSAQLGRLSPYNNGDLCLLRFRCSLVLFVWQMKCRKTYISVHTRLCK